MDTQQLFNAGGTGFYKPSAIQYFLAPQQLVNGVHALRAFRMTSL
jgi:hypothetical protein